MRGFESDMNRLAQRNNLGPLVGSTVEVRSCGNMIVTYSYLEGRIPFDDDASEFTIERNNANAGKELIQP